MDAVINRLHRCNETKLWFAEYWCDCWLESCHLKLVSKLLDRHYIACLFLYCESAADVVAVEAEWSAAGNVGDGADESVLDGLCQWLWDWWQWWGPASILRQVQKHWASSFHSAVFSLFILASDSDRLARITDWSLGQTQAQEAHWMWVNQSINRTLFILHWQWHAGIDSTSGYAMWFTAGGAIREPQNP